MVNIKSISLIISQFFWMAVLNPRDGCARSHHLWAQKAQGRCEHVFVDSWCVLICTCAEVVRSKSKIYLAFTILLCQCYDMHLSCTITWPCTCLMAFVLPAHLIRCSTSQPCRLVPTVRSPPRWPICQVVDLSLPVHLPDRLIVVPHVTWSDHWPIRWDRIVVYPSNLETCQT